MYYLIFRFDKSNSDLSSIVYTGSEDGTIKLWDLRLQEKCVSIFKGTKMCCTNNLFLIYCCNSIY